MTTLLSRVSTLPNICGIELATTGTMLPSTIQGYQQFANSITQNADFISAHSGRAAVSFSEESVKSNAGIPYKQKLTIQFPGSDALRSDRIIYINKTRYIKILLSNGKHLLLGRNDFAQNARPIISIKTDHRLVQAEFETTSIMPTGYTPAFDAFGLPVFFPITFIPD